MKNRVTQLEVYDFKENWCNENKIITNMLKGKLNKYLLPPILDVGSGLGDIAYNAFPDKESILIDVNEISEDESPLSRKHTRHCISFFDYSPETKINTVLIAHTLQFLDNSIPALNRKLNAIAPQYLIVVLNENTDFMGEIIAWIKDNCKESNPEVHHDDFPQGYRLKKAIPFQATLMCPNYDKLVKQISYLMLVDLKEKSDELKSFLSSNLKRPGFQFRQTIQVYGKD